MLIFHAMNRQRIIYYVLHTSKRIVQNSTRSSFNFKSNYVLHELFFWVIFIFFCILYSVCSFVLSRKCSRLLKWYFKVENVKNKNVFFCVLWCKLGQPFSISTNCSWKTKKILVKIGRMDVQIVLCNFLSLSGQFSIRVISFF